MKKNLKIARRYAKALMLLAKEQNQVEAYRENLAQITELICGSELESALLNPVYLAEQRRNALKAVLDKLRIEEMLYRFVVFLFDKERLDELDLINDAFQIMADAESGVIHAYVSSAVPVPDEITQKIADAVMRYSGRKVIFDIKEDPALIGGVITRLGDHVFDGSVRTRVDNLRDALKQG